MTRRPLLTELARVRPDLEDPVAVIAAGLVFVDGRPVANPRSHVPVGCSIVVRAEPELRGSAKLEAALDAFGVVVDGRVALDCGAAAGGFTRVLLDRGAARVYAVDAGHGQLVGSLRQDPRVVNLEGVNLGALHRSMVPEAVSVVTLDLSYLSLADAVPQLAARIEVAAGADLVALVKPMFELHLDHAPTDPESLAAALEAAQAGVTAAGLTVVATIESPVRGSKGALEGFLHATLPRG